MKEIKENTDAVLVSKREGTHVGVCVCVGGMFTAGKMISHFPQTHHGGVVAPHRPANQAHFCPPTPPPQTRRPPSPTAVHSGLRGGNQEVATSGPGSLISTPVCFSSPERNLITGNGGRNGRPAAAIISRAGAEERS